MGLSVLQGDSVTSLTARSSAKVSILTYGNAIFILIFLRSVVPRLLVRLGSNGHGEAAKLL